MVPRKSTHSVPQYLCRAPVGARGLVRDAYESQIWYALCTCVRNKDFNLPAIIPIYHEHTHLERCVAFQGFD
ncbi:uncharacterized protein H6S33_006146 [Morchella sextelata]|uniref:uncharacterized protein n=1 Tax=Morchella sextelata TaxID=1174677 RepID=UPI001D03D5E3|nr:uncharacterized protein H6S33_006146 [Morchella sextelata]KAH0614260.1 hypothetical protein H6S33_006146 [Morchella sextelata]